LKSVLHEGFPHRVAPAPFITISRETGAGGSTVGRLLVDLLNAAPNATHPWLFLDRELLLRALEHAHLPARLEAFLPEDTVGEIRGVIGELAGLHPPLWDLNTRVADAILRFAHLGHVILAGRGATWITQRRPGGLHVRLVASLERRATRMAATRSLSQSAAEAHCLKTDLARRRFVRSHFDQDVDDPRNYDLVINTDTLPLASAAHLIAQALFEKRRAMS
jgi:cytidylate kinase